MRSRFLRVVCISEILNFPPISYNQEKRFLAGTASLGICLSLLNSIRRGCRGLCLGFNFLG